MKALLHRYIKVAGFLPENVWEDSSTDKISERVIANVFAADIAIVDVTDDNPNVMIELGMRLSSEKPIVIVAEKGTRRPFDIADFQYEAYPGDLNILGMEDFSERLCLALKVKHEAFKKGEYTPFLRKVIVDVLKPSERPVGKDDYILSKLDEVASRLSRMEGSARGTESDSNFITKKIPGPRTYFALKTDKVSEAMSVLGPYYKNIRPICIVGDVIYYEGIGFSTQEQRAEMAEKLKTLESSLGISESLLRTLEKGNVEQSSGTNGRTIIAVSG